MPKGAKKSVLFFATSMAFLWSGPRSTIRMSCLEMSPSMHAVFDIDRLNAIFSPNWRCTSKVCD